MDDDNSVQWLESDEQVDVVTEEVIAPVLPSSRSKRKRASNPEPESSDSGQYVEESDKEAGDEDASDASSRYKPATRHKRQRVNAPVNQANSTINSMAAPPQATGGKSRAALSALLNKGKGRAHTSWCPEEDQMAEDIMREIKDNGKGDGRFVEMSERMTAAGYKRSYTAVKNQWNRRLREVTGLDERRKKKGPLATSKQDRATKEARKQRKLAKEAEEQRLKEDEGEESAEPSEEDGEEEMEDEELRSETDADDEHEEDEEGEEGEDDEEQHEQYEIRRDACVCMGRIDDHMIECDNQDECTGARWYHLWCAGFTIGPAEPWVCAICEMD